MTTRYCIGIDLGTTNSVLAFTPLDCTPPDVQILPIPQVTAPFQTESLPSLPSFIYLPRESEQADGGLASFGNSVVGTYARQISAEQPERSVVAAKSWLCNREVDRQSPILPWQAPEEVAQISPVDASTAYLKHLVETWQKAFPDAPIEQQRITLTVPASFDIVARELTMVAAKLAGLPEDMILLEEPQAALYHWIRSIGDDWRKHVQQGDQILVCDCGGGTTDLTLLVVDADSGELNLRRIAVGNHLLIGGDNMDLTLAHHAAQRFTAQGVKLNAWQSIGLWHACRNAKESLLSGSGLQSHTVSVLGRGSRLIGGTVSIEMRKEEIEGILVDGFFPRCDRNDRPDRGTSSGFQELGLPYESDTAVTRHVASFLQDHLPSELTSQSNLSSNASHFPTRLLFNGGVFKSPMLRERMMEVLSSWSDEGTVPEMLGGPNDLDSAVASGAAYYAWSKANGGVRIRGGTPCSYYVGIESTGPAVPGMPRPVQAVCVAPQGMEEGTESVIPGREFGLVVGKHAKFRFFSSNRRSQDTFGNVLRNWDDEELIESDSIEILLDASPVDPNNEAAPTGAAVATSGPPSSIIPVRFLSKITELGMFELWCIGTRESGRWKLTFNVRD
ncbi:MAG: Hsp70 family protein [Pirellulaceae bacterium]|nr:Hsp70 family protein [Pirellulaceae bacterium]